MTSYASTTPEDTAARAGLYRLSALAALFAVLSISLAALLNLAGHAGETVSPLLLNFYAALISGTLDGWLAVVGAGFFLLAAVGLAYLLHRPGSFAWLAFASVGAGAAALLVGFLLALVMARQLDPRLPEALPSTRPAMMVLAGTLVTTADLLLVVGSGFLFGLGVGLFGYFSLSSAAVPNWAGWLGIATAILHVGWLDILVPNPANVVLTYVKILDLLLFLLWLSAMAAALWRCSTTPSR